MVEVCVAKGTTGAGAASETASGTGASWVGLGDWSGAGADAGTDIGIGGAVSLSSDRPASSLFASSSSFLALARASSSLIF
jgi:hypothetical protein